MGNFLKRVNFAVLNFVATNTRPASTVT